MDPIEAAFAAAAGEQAGRAAAPATSLTGVADRIAQLEGTGQNPRSSSRGVGQFTNDTWVGTYRRHADVRGMSDQQVLALRDDPATARQMLGHLVDDNAAALTAAGHEATPGHVYLANHFGAGGANSILRADPNAPIGSIVGDAVMRANPQLAGMTAGSVTAMLAGKMGDAPEGSPHGAANPQPNPDPNDPIEAALSSYAEGRGAPPPPQPQTAAMLPAAPGEGLATSVGHGVHDFGVGAMRGAMDVLGTGAWAIDKAAGTHLQDSTDLAQHNLAARQYDPDGWGSSAGRLGADVLMTAPLGEVRALAAIPAAGRAIAASRAAKAAGESLPMGKRLAAALAGMGDMSLQGAAAGAATSGGHDVGTSAAAGAVFAPVVGAAAEKAIPVALKAGERAKALGRALLGSDDITATIPRVPTPAAAGQGLAGWSDQDAAQGWRRAADGSVEFAPTPTIRKGSDLEPSPGGMVTGPDGKQHLYVEIDGPGAQAQRGAAPGAAPAAPSAPPGSGASPLAADDVRQALGSPGARNGIESTTDMPPAVAQHVERLTSQGVPLEQAIREADITFVGGKPTIAAVTRDPAHQQALNEGAKLVQTAEGRALNAQVAGNNAAVTKAMQGLVGRYGGVPSQGEAAEAAATSLAKASDAEKARVSRLYDAADEEAAGQKWASDLKTMAAQRDADRLAGRQAQDAARTALDQAQQALKAARGAPGSKGVGNMEQARARVADARAKLRDVTNNPPVATPVKVAPGGGYIDVSPLRKALDAPELVNPTIEGGKTLRSGVMGLLDAYAGDTGRVTLAEAERLRQAIGDAYDPLGGGINHHVGRLKGVLDEALDSTEAGPAFKQARAAHKAWAEKYDDPEGVARLTRRDAKGNFRSEDNWRQAENGLVGTLSDKGFTQVVTRLRANGDTATLDRLKATILQRAYQAAVKGAQDSSGNAVASGLNFFTALNEKVGMPKLRAIFSPDELAEIAATGRAAVHLNTAVPGTVNHSNTASTLLSDDMASRMMAGLTKTKEKKGGAGIYAGSSIAGGVASLLGHTVAGPVAAVGIPAVKFTADALSKRAAARAVADGLKDAMDPAAARAAAGARKADLAAAEKRRALARALAGHGGRAGGMSDTARKAAAAILSRPDDTRAAGSRP